MIELNRGTQEDWNMLQRAVVTADRLGQAGLLTAQQKEDSARFQQELAGGSGWHRRRGWLGLLLRCEPRRRSIAFQQVEDSGEQLVQLATRHAHPANVF
jgi:hypothetical protein